MNFKKSMICLIIATTLIALPACSKKETNAKMTIPFNFGDRTGSYIGSTNENGAPDGMGIFASKTPDGAEWSYSGEWENGHWNGQGISKWASGDSYCGSYSQDSETGYGIYTNSDGTVIVGKFENGSPSGYCALYLDGGMVFWGNYVNGEAAGIIHMPDGSTVEATHKGGNIQFNIANSDINIENPDNEKDQEKQVQEIDDTLETEETVITEPTQKPISQSMRNALRAAGDYLKIMPFSYAGLIQQLEFDQYSHEDAVYAADNCGANWSDQAARSAKNYLEIMAFSRGSLIEQLQYEGFTYEEAVYGVEKNGL